MALSLSLPAAYLALSAQSPRQHQRKLQEVVCGTPDSLRKGEPFLCQEELLKLEGEVVSAQEEISLIICLMDDRALTSSKTFKEKG